MTTPTREQVGALCADLDEHTKDERGYCDRCMFRWPCGVVEIRDTLRALLADNERLRECLRDGLVKGRERLGASLREFGYDSMAFAEARAVWLELMLTTRQHVGADTVSCWLAARREDGA